MFGLMRAMLCKILAVLTASAQNLFDNPELISMYLEENNSLNCSFSNAIVFRSVGSRSGLYCQSKTIGLP